MSDEMIYEEISDEEIQKELESFRAIGIALDHKNHGENPDILFDVMESIYQHRKGAPETQCHDIDTAKA